MRPKAIAAKDFAWLLGMGLPFSRRMSLFTNV
jgi:hypothetical protein